jgi:N-acetylglucosamine malate deacetylase 1
MHYDKIVLVVAAHPDDEVLGCAATVARLKRDGWRAVLMLMTRGAAGRAKTFDGVNASHISAQQSLAEETRQAASIIGYDRIISHDFPDNRMDTVPKADVAHLVAQAVLEEKPHLILTHHPGDYNWDHTVTFEAVMMGARRNPPDFSPSEIRTFEILSSTERAWQTQALAFHPNCWIEVASTIDKKYESLKCYHSELRSYPHPRSPEAVRVLAQKRGNEVGVEYAEAFHIVRRVEG